jgi:hypothetical protein
MPKKKKAGESPAFLKMVEAAGQCKEPLLQVTFDLT